MLRKRTPTTAANEQSSLVGEYNCGHCKESMAEPDRFQVSGCSIELDGFCCPECSATYSNECVGGSVDERNYRHSMIESAANRRVGYAPTRAYLIRHRGFKRERWLKVIHENMSDAERMIASKELVVVSNKSGGGRRKE